MRIHWLLPKRLSWLAILNYLFLGWLTFRLYKCNDWKDLNDATSVYCVGYKLVVGIIPFTDHTLPFARCLWWSPGFKRWVTTQRALR